MINKLTIIFDDGYIALNGEPLVMGSISVKEFGNGLYHAVQYENGSGWVEFKEINGHKPINAPIQDLSPFRPLVEQFLSDED